jgi:DedD protein
MARSISEEELQLRKRARRRLVGAVVLVTAIAVILPMVLDSEPQPVGQSVEIHIPSPDAGEFKPQSPSAKAGDPRAVQTEQPSAPLAPAVEPEQREERPTAQADARAAPEARSAPAAAARDKAGPTAAKEAAKAPARESPPASGASYVVQVAALSDAAKAKQLQRQVAATGVKAYTEVVAVQSGVVTRVRAGPYATREAAEDAREQLRKAGFEGRVVAR